MQVDVALQFLIDIVDFLVIDQRGDFSLLQRFGKEGDTLVHHLDIAVVEHLLQPLELLVARPDRGLGFPARLHHLYLGTLLALTGSLDFLAVAVEREAHVHHHSVDRLSLLGVPAVAHREVGQPLALLYLHVHLGCLERGFGCLDVGVVGQCQRFKRLVVCDGCKLRHSGHVDLYGLSTVELLELLEQQYALVARFGHQGFHLHDIEFHLVEFQDVGVAHLHTLLVHTAQLLTARETLVEHTERLVEAYMIRVESTSTFDETPLT